jgi:hypothetical protein
MRACRLIFAVVLAIALAALPVAAAMAMTHAGKAHASMSAAGDDCLCCNPTQPPEKCSDKCCHVQAIAVDGVLILPPVAVVDARASARPGTAISTRPDPPPPRL